MTRIGSILSCALLGSTALTWGSMAQAQQAQPAAPSQQMEEIIVRGRYIPEPKKESPEIASFLSAEDFARQGDSNIALSLRRVTGLSLVGGKYIYIRGLGERYSSATLNGLPMPSPEPLRRVVPLDLFPTSILASAAAQKTYSPQHSGEFGGGLVEIKTKAVPDEQIIELGVSVGANNETTWRSGLQYDGGKHDWLGFDSGIRDIPGPLQAAIDSGKRVNSLNFTDTELQQIGRSLTNSELWVLFEGTTPGDIELTGTYGDRFLIGDASVGIIASAGYDNSWQTKRGLQQSGRFGVDAQGNRQLLVADDFSFTSTQNDLQWHGLVGVGADWDAHEVKATGFWVHTTTKEARVVEGKAIQFDSYQRQDFLEWFERQMWTGQLDGTHRFENDALTINWKGSYSQASRDAPYERSVQYRDFGDGRIRYDQQVGRNLTRFSTIDDELLAGAIDVNYAATIANREVNLKAGYLFTDTDRRAEQRDYRLNPTGGPLPDALTLRRIDYILSDLNINPNRFVITEVTGSSAPPAYDGSLKVHGGYAGTDAQLGDFLRAALGVRYEKGDQIVDTFDFYTPNTSVETNIKKSYWLPAATLTWNFAESMQMRLGGSKTIGRPQFRELAPAEFIDVDTDRRFFGNPNLVNSTIYNADARFEWYYAEQQYFTLGGFFKHLNKPIEETVEAAADNIFTSFQNVPRARLYGGEVEVKHLFELETRDTWLSSLSYFVAANYTYSKSSINLKAGDTVVRANGTVLPAEFVVQDGRPLQGHSKHLANFQIGFEDAEARSAATLLVNYASKRIRSSAPQNQPEIIERPPVTLDLTFSKSFDMWGSEYEAGVKLENLLASRYKATQEFNGAKVNVDTYKLGQSISLSLKVKL